MGVNCSDVLAVRLWLDQKLRLRSPSNVVAGFDEGVGGTFFQLDSLQVIFLGASVCSYYIGDDSCVSIKQRGGRLR
jgi:hypothetical protein